MIVLSILLLSVSVISHNTISNEMMVENQSLSFAQAQDNISSLFSQMVYTVSQIALNNDLVSNLRQPVTDQYDYYARLRTMSEYLSTFSSQSDAYGMRILLIGTNGMKYGASLELADPLCITMEELNHLEITKKMLANKRMLICKQLHPRIHRQSGERVTLLGLILHSEYIDKVYGYLYISIEENAFHKLYL